MDVAQCDAPAAQRTTLADSIGVRADACGHGKLGGLLSGKLGDNRFLVRSSVQPVAVRHLMPHARAVSPYRPRILRSGAHLCPSAPGCFREAPVQLKPRAISQLTVVMIACARAGILCEERAQRLS